MNCKYKMFLVIQDAWEWHKAARGEVQTGHQEMLLHCEGGQILEPRVGTSLLLMYSALNNKF